MLYPNSLVTDWSRLVLQQKQHTFRIQFYLERLEYWERFLKSKASGCGWISTVFSSIVLLFVSSIIILIIIIIILLVNTETKVVLGNFFLGKFPLKNPHPEYYHPFHCLSLLNTLFINRRESVHEHHPPWTKYLNIPRTAQCYKFKNVPLS